MNLHNFYLNSNPDRKKLGKSKFGYVKGGKQNLANRIGDSREQFSDHSVFTHIFTFVKTGDYKVPPEVQAILDKNTPTSPK